MQIPLQYSLYNQCINSPKKKIVQGCFLYYIIEGWIIPIKHKLIVQFINVSSYVDLNQFVTN